MVGEKITKTARVTLQKSYAKPGSVFRVHFDTLGTNAPPMADLDASGVPDWVEQTANSADSVLNRYLIMGYEVGLKDLGTGGDVRYDIYLRNLAPQYVYGLTYSGSDGYMEIDNDFAESIYAYPDVFDSRGARGLRVTLAHEMFHSIQFLYVSYRTDWAWWMEMTATSMEELMYTDVNDYYQYLRPDWYKDTVFENPALGLTSNASGSVHPYSGTVFLLFMWQKHGSTALTGIRDTFAARDLSTATVIAKLQNATGVAMRDLLSEFWVWSYYSGDRYRPQFFEEGARYKPAPLDSAQYPVSAARFTLRDISSIGDTTVADTTAFLGARLVRVVPDGTVNAVTVSMTGIGTYAGQWTLRVAAAYPDTVRYFPVDVDVQTGGARVVMGSVDWQGAQDVLIVAANDATSGSTLPFTYRVQYSQSTIVWVPRADTTCSENELLVFTVSAANQSGGEVEYAAPVLPSGACFDPATATFTWRPERSQIGDTLAVFSASGVLDTVGITVTRAPVILSVPADTTVQPSQQFALPVRISGMTLQDNVTSFNLGVRVPLDVITVESVVKGPILPSGAGFSWVAREDLMVVGGYWVAPLDTDGVLFSLLCTVKPEARDTVCQVALERLLQNGVLLDYLNEKGEPPCVAQGGLLRVQTPNSPPIWTPTPDVTADECVLLTLAFSATDPEGGTIVYSATGLPDGATLDAAAGLFSWTPSYAQAGVYTVTFTASDGIKSADDVVVITINNAASGELSLPAAAGVKGATVQAAVTGSVAECAGINLEFLVPTDVVENVTVVSSPFPEREISLIENTVRVGLASGPKVTVTDGEIVRLAFTIRAEAVAPQTADLTFAPYPATEVDEQPATLTDGTVQVLNRAPVWTALADQQADPNTEWPELSFAIEATDPDGHEVSYQMLDHPTGAQFQISTRTFTWRPVFEQAGDTVVVFRATDGYDAVNDTIAISVWDYYGDVTLDKTVTTFDASQVLKYSVRLEPNDVTTKGTLEVADVSDNGRATAYDAGLILHRAIVDWDFIFPARSAGTKSARPAETLPRSIAFVLAEGGWNLVVSQPDGIIGCDLELLLPEGTAATFSGDGAIEHAIDGQTALVGIARVQFANPVLLHVSGTAGPPQIVSASLNEGMIPAALNAPPAFTLSQNAPNPFNPSTTLRFALPEAGQVTLAVYDVNGRLVRNLVARRFEAGRHEVVWDGKDGNGRAVASGAYVYRLTAKHGVVTKRMVLLR